MTLKAFKFGFILTMMISLPRLITAQCDSEAINSTLSISLDDCKSNTIEGTNVDYSEFTATVSNAGVCNNVSLGGPGHLYRNDPITNPHSCTPGVGDTPGMCVGYDQSCVYTPDSDQAVRFDVVLNPTSGSSSITSLDFYELAPVQFQYLGGISGQNNYPLFYAVRVSVNGNEIFHETDVETSTIWSLESYDFSGIPEFTVSTATTFNFELTAYCRVNNGADIAVWDLDEISVNTTCQSADVDLDANFDIAGGQTATSCNSTTFTFVNGANPAGAECTWYFNWPSTDPSTVVVGTNPTYTFPAEGIYTIRKEVSFGNCFESSELTVSAFDTGVIGAGVGGSLDGIDANVISCSGNTVNIDLVSTAFDTNDGYEVNSWAWNITVNGVPQTTSGPSVSLVLGSTDNVSVTLVATSTSGCQGTFSESFNVQDLIPNASYVLSIAECTDNGYILSLADNTNHQGLTVSSYVWNVVANGETINPGNVSSFVFEAIEDIVSISHTVIYDNGCEASAFNETISIQDDLLPGLDIVIVGDTTGGGGGGMNGDCEEAIDQVLQLNITGGTALGTVTSVDWIVVVGGQTYTFTGNPIDLNGLITGPAVVTASVTYSNGCVISHTENFEPSDFGGGGSGMITVDFNGNPVIDCPGDMTPILLNPNPNYQYTWDPTAGLTFTDMVNFSDPIVTVTTPTVYNVSIADGACILDTSILVIPQDAAIPEIMLNGLGDDNNIFCDGQVSASVVNPIPGVNYEWSCGNDFTQIIGTGVNLFWSGGSFGDKDLCVRISGANAACDISACVAISDGAIDDFTFNGNPVIDCEEDDTPIVLQTNPNYSYTWDPTDGLTFTDMVNFTDPIVSVTEITTYNVTITDGVCVLDTSVLVIPEELAIPDVTPNGVGPDGNVFCDGMISLTIENPIPGLDYEWTCDGEVIGTGTTLEYDAGMFGEKEICVQIAGIMPMCDVSTCTTVIDGTPDVSYVNPLTMCPGDTIQYEIINNEPDEELTIVFENDPHIVSVDENGLPTIGVGEDEDPFFIPFSITSNDYGCVLLDTLEVLPGINEQLDFEWTLAECGTFTIDFTALNIDSINGMPLWNFGDPTTDADTSNIFNPSWTYPDTGFYTVTLMDFAELCPGLETEMEIYVPEEPMVTIMAPDTIVSDTTPIMIMADTNLDPEDIVWCDADGEPIGMGPKLTYEPDSIDCVFAKISDEFGCADTAKVFIFIEDGMFTDIDGIEGPDEGVCENDTFSLTLLVENPDDYAYNWGPEACIVSGGNSPVVTATVQDVDKEFSVTVTDIDSGADSIFTYLVMVNSLDITLDCDFDDGIINWGEDGTISVLGAPDGSTYVWSNGDTGSSTTVSPTEDTGYSVTVTDPNGCTAEASKDIEVRQVMCTEEGVFIPTAFSPNADGVNDNFRLSSLWIESVELFIVYDRWGEEVYNANGTFGSWDGTFGNEELAPDVFAYCIKGTCVDGSEFTRVGNVSLLK